MTNTSYYNNMWKAADPQPDIKSMKLAEPGKDIDKLLYDLLRHASPHGRESVIADIICDFVQGYPDISPFKDAKGNLHIQVGKSPKTMFSCHMDTVHSNTTPKTIDIHMSDDGHVHASTPRETSYYVDAENSRITEAQMKQQAKTAGHSYTYYTLFANNGVATKRKLFGSNSQFDGWQPTDLLYTVETEVEATPCVLGADDKLGCYIMCRLIEAGVEGYYVFHVGEECGGIGSSYLSTQRADKFKSFNHCIAFDRMRYEDIITHQSGGRCCSDDFAQALASQLNPNLPPMQQMAPSPNGSFTDSANYTGLIPECTNIAVGYFSQHTSNERFDHMWLENMLIPALLKVDWASLPVVRQTGKPDAPRFRGARGYTHGYGQGYGSYSSPKQTSLVQSGRSEAQQSQSALDRLDNALKAVHSFDPEFGFYPEETHRQKVKRVLASFIRDRLSLEDIAELVVDTAEANKNDYLYDNFPFK